jgi:hypothetical protein
MNRKTLLSLLILLVLLAVAIVVYKNYKTGTVKKELTNFAVADTAAITKIFMADKNNQKVLLEKRADGTWMVNNKFIAKQGMVNSLLETIYSIRVKELIPKGGFNTVIKNLATKSTKVEIYKKGELNRVYYVGGSTQDNKGTFMMLENSATPFIMWIPGFEGYLTTRYTVIEKDWKTQRVFSYYPNQITSVKIEYPRKPEDSFELLSSGNSFALKDLQNGNTVPLTDRAKAIDFLLGFKELNYEAILDGLTEYQKDSIKKTIPMIIVTVKDIQGRENRLVNYPRKPNPGARDLEGKLYEFSPEKLSGILNDDKDFVLIQYFAFDKVFKKKSYFLEKAKKP